MIMIGIETAGLLPITGMMIITDITRIGLLITIAVILMMTDVGLITMAPAEVLEINMGRINQIIDQEAVITETSITPTGIGMIMEAQIREGLAIQVI